MPENPVVTTTITGTVSATILAALLRGGGQALLAGLIATLTAHQQGLSWDSAITTGVVLFLTGLGTRAGVEGAIDAARQAKGNVASSDIQPNAEAVQP